MCGLYQGEYNLCCFEDSWYVTRHYGVVNAGSDEQEVNKGDFKRLEPTTSIEDVCVA